MEAKIVLGMQFGDEGKGITTDYLCSHSPKPIVIRFSGGQQAGHTVMLGDKKHVHSNFGAGTLRGIPSYFSEHCTMYLNTMDYERRLLAKKDIVATPYVHPLTKMTTPYDVAYNRITERKLGHGSCGLGIAATMKRHLETGYKFYAIDTFQHGMALEKLRNIREYYLSKLAKDDIIPFLHEADSQMDTYKRLLVSKPFFIASYDFLKGYETLIFEGSQGIMLDMDHGIFPNVTFANTTCKNALEILTKVGAPTPEIYYVTRCYQTRHGNGWMSSTKPVELINTQEEINSYNEWQTNFRTAEIDYNLLEYTLMIDEQYHKAPYKKHLVVTCMDQRPDFKFDYSRVNGYLFTTRIESYSPYSKDMKIV